MSDVASEKKSSNMKDKKNPKCVHGKARMMCRQCRCGCRDGKQYWGSCVRCGPGACIHGLHRCSQCWLCEHRKWNSNCVQCMGFESHAAKIAHGEVTESAGSACAGSACADRRWQSEVEYYARNELDFTQLCNEVAAKRKEMHSNCEAKRRKYCCAHGKRKYDCKICAGY